MKSKFYFNHKLSLLGAIASASIASSGIVVVLSFFVAKPYLTDYVRGVVRNHQSTVESFFVESISQQVLVGDGPEVLRKCHSLLRENYVRAVYIKDLSGEVICNLKKPDDSYSIRWSKSPLYFDESRKSLATNVWLAFSTQTEERLIWIAVLAAILGAVLLLIIQILLSIPISRRILQPLADISKAVNIGNPDDVLLPDLKNYSPVVNEVRSIFQSMQDYIKRLALYRAQLIESTRFEAVTRTVQIIAHDLKAPMASFERLTRIPENQFAQEKKYLVQALRQLYSMTDAIKRAEFEDIVRIKPDVLNLESTERHCASIAEKLGKSLLFQGPSLLENLDIDQPKLTRALANLVINALEAASTRVTVTVKLEVEGLSLIVEDDGLGVPPELLERLFLRGATHGKAEGTVKWTPKTRPVT